MKTSTVELYRQALDLDEQDRATLAGLLIESLEEEPDKDLEMAWEGEIHRRIEELDSGLVETISWKDVKDRLWQNLNRD